MKRFLGLCLTASFILWILPLGVFIKPSNEHLACDGQRAICMCHALVPKSSSKAMEAGLLLKVASATSQENPSSGAGHYFVSSRPIVLLNAQALSFFRHHSLCYNNPYLATLEYVPKI